MFPFSSQHSDWSDWEEHPTTAVCLFCEKQAEAMETLRAHMEVSGLWPPESASALPGKPVVTAMPPGYPLAVLTPSLKRARSTAEGTGPVHAGEPEPGQPRTVDWTCASSSRGISQAALVPPSVRPYAVILA